MWHFSFLFRVLQASPMSYRDWHRCNVIRHVSSFTVHSGRSADKSNLPVLGELHFTLNFGNLDLPITALVVERLDCDILAGIPFYKTNDIYVHLKAETISIGNSTIPYGNRGRDVSNTRLRQIRRINATLLRNDSEKIFMPGEYIEFKSPALQDLDCEVAIEPHTPAHNRSVLTVSYTHLTLPTILLV